MPKYIIRIVQKNDYKSIAEIYNSNPHFLFHHLGVDFIDEAFVSEEVSTMQKAGFHSCVIVDQESSMVQGVLDYKPNQEVYLSLLMLSASLQGKGMGSDIWFGSHTLCKITSSQSPTFARSIKGFGVYFPANTRSTSSKGTKISPSGSWSPYLL